MHHFVHQPPSTKGKRTELGRGKAKNYWASVTCQILRWQESSFAYTFSFSQLFNPKKEAALSPGSN